MKCKFTTFTALGLSAALLANAQTPTKIGIINIEQAILGTKDGQKAANDLQTRFNPKKADLDKKQNDVEQARAQLQRGSSTMSDEAKQKLMREIDQKTKSLNRDTEDAQTELNQEQQKIMQELGQRLMAVVGKYAKDNGYTLILDVSSPQSPILWAADATEITRDIVALYDKNAPAASAPAAESKPSTQAPPPRPVTPSVAPPKKK